MAAGKKRAHRHTKRKKKLGAKRIAEIKDKLEKQRRRALRPTLPVNMQAQVSETLTERKTKAARRLKQRRAWDEL